MTAKAALLAGQRAAERLMTDSCTVSRVVTVVDPVEYTTSEQEVEVWAGRCKVTTYEPDAIDLVSAGRPVTTQEYRLHVPNGAGPFRVGDLAVVAGYPHVFRIDGLLLKTFQTAQRLKVTVQSNQEAT